MIYVAFLVIVVPLLVAVAVLHRSNERLLDQVDALTAELAARDKSILARTLDLEAREDAIRDLTSAGDALDKALASSKELLTTQATAITELEHQNHSLDTKLKNTQAHIASAVGQREFWQEWYHRQAAEHGAAQHLFLAELELHVKRGPNHPISPVFRELVKDFGDVHPSLADAGQPAKEGDKPLSAR